MFYLCIVLVACLAAINAAVADVSISGISPTSGSMAGGTRCVYSVLIHQDPVTARLLRFSLASMTL